MLIADVGVSYRSAVSSENASSRLSTDLLTGSAQTRLARPEWRKASTHRERTGS